MYAKHPAWHQVKAANRLYLLLKNAEIEIGAVLY